MTNKVQRAFAPASIANIACGFDVLGMAIYGIGDEVEASLNDTGMVTLEVINTHNFSLPASDASKNTAGLAVIKLLEKAKISTGVHLKLYKKMPLGSGLGSSAASAAAAVMAVNALLGNIFDKHTLASLAAEGEMAASGAIHADNAAPSVIGGIVLVQNNRYISIPAPADMHIVVVHPEVEIFTKQARSILPLQIATKQTMLQASYLAGFISACYTANYELMAASMIDTIAEPVRAALIPHYAEAKAGALANGAIGCNISGSGPSIFALCNGLNTANKVADAMAQVYETQNLSYNNYVSEVNMEGAVLV